MTTEIKRDLAMDLCFCEETEPTGFIVGPTTNEGTSLLSEKERRLCAKTATVEIAEFISEAREGWPHAIRRALAAETELAAEEERRHVCEVKADEWSYENARIHASVEKLRQAYERGDSDEALASAVSEFLQEVA